MKKFQRSAATRRHDHAATATACRWGLVGLVAALGGCGSIPDAEIRYYLATSSVSVTATRSVLCDAEKVPVVATTVALAASHRAHTESNENYVVDLAWFRGPFSDADVKVESYDDGRLKTLNAASTGQGEAVLKGAATLTGLVLGAVVNGVPKSSTRTSFPEQCDDIAKQNAGKPIVIVYNHSLDLTEDLSNGKRGKAQVVEPDGASKVFAEMASPAIGQVCVVVTAHDKPKKSPLTKTSDTLHRVLKARQPGRVDFEIQASVSGACTGNDPLIAKRSAPVAQFGLDYDIPVPLPAAFGKQSMGLVFAESGALTSVQYTSSSGAAQALGGLNALLAAAQGSTTAQEAAEVKAQADLIVQQQRLVQCIATPKDCPK